MNRLGEPPIHLIANNVWLYVLNVFTISNCKSCGRANLGKLLLGKSPHRGCGGCGWNFHDGLILMSAPTEWTCGQGQGIPYFARWSRLRGWLHGRLPWKRNCRRQSMDWFVWENFNRKAPWSSWENREFPVEIFPTKPIHWVNHAPIMGPIPSLGAESFGLAPLGNFCWFFCFRLLYNICCAAMAAFLRRFQGCIVQFPHINSLSVSE